MKLNWKLGLIALALPLGAFADEIHVGGPVYPSTVMQAETKEVANVLLQNLDEIHRQLADNALLGKVTIRAGALQTRQPLGRDHKIYSFDLEHCRHSPPGGCENVGTLEIHESLFLRPGEEVRSYDVELKYPATE